MFVHNYVKNGTSFFQILFKAVAVASRIF